MSRNDEMRWRDLHLLCRRSIKAKWHYIQRVKHSIEVGACKFDQRNCWKYRCWELRKQFYSVEMNVLNHLHGHLFPSFITNHLIFFFLELNLQKWCKSQTIKIDVLWWLKNSILKCYADVRDTIELFQQYCPFTFIFWDLAMTFQTFIFLFWISVFIWVTVICGATEIS